MFVHEILQKGICARPRHVPRHRAANVEVEAPTLHFEQPWGRRDGCPKALPTRKSQRRC